MGVVDSSATDTGSEFADLKYFDYLYTFANAQTYFISHAKAADQVEADTTLAAQIPAVEQLMIDRSRSDTSRLVLSAGTLPGSGVELFIPDFPEEIPESDPNEDVDTRQRDFHRWLLRDSWSEDLVRFAELYLGLWLWIEQKSPPNIRDYLGLDVPGYNTVNQRMGNARTVDGLVKADDPQGDPPPEV